MRYDGRSDPRRQCDHRRRGGGRRRRRRRRRGGGPRRGRAGGEPHEHDGRGRDRLLARRRDAEEVEQPGEHLDEGHREGQRDDDPARKERVVAGTADRLRPAIERPATTIHWRTLRRGGKVAPRCARSGGVVEVESFIRAIPDFPIPGILFRDITPLLRDAGGFKASIDLFTQHYRASDIDIVVGIKARGYMFGGRSRTSSARASSRCASPANSRARRSAKSTRSSTARTRSRSTPTRSTTARASSSSTTCSPRRDRGRDAPAARQTRRASRGLRFPDRDPGPRRPCRYLPHIQVAPFLALKFLARHAKRHTRTWSIPPTVPGQLGSTMTAPAARPTTVCSRIEHPRPISPSLPHHSRPSLSLAP